MSLFEYYLQYMTEVFEGKRQAPEGITLTSEDAGERMKELGEQLGAIGMAEFVRRCAAQDGTELPAELFEGDANADAMAFFAQNAQNTEITEQPAEEPQEEPAPDPDKDKHAFEVFLDCIEMDDGLVQYLIEVLKTKDWKEFFKLSQITTKMDLDPEEFLFWLGNKELYGSEEEQACVAIMDGCMERLLSEKRLDVLAALLSGDQNTFELFRCEAPELVHLPDATFDWYCRNYLDRDYPIRVLMKCNGVVFPTTKA